MRHTTTKNDRFFKCLGNVRGRRRFLALLLPILFLMQLNVVAEQSQPHPIIDKPVPGYERSEQLSEMQLEQLLGLRDEYISEVNRLDDIVAKEHKNDQYLLDKLVAYDRERLRIIEIIPTLIKDYDIKPPFSESLLRYAKTFENLDEQYRGQLKTLDDYRSYDFRLGMAYLSMMASMQEQADLYQHLHADMEDENTAIGAYIKQLNVAYAEVEKASDDIDELNVIRHLRRELERIEQELNSRR